MKKLFKFIRTSMGLSYESFGDAFNVQPMIVQKWESGELVPDDVIQKGLYNFAVEHQISILDFIVEEYKKDNQLYYCYQDKVSVVLTDNIIHALSISISENAKLSIVKMKNELNIIKLTDTESIQYILYKLGKAFKNEKITKWTSNYDIIEHIALNDKISYLLNNYNSLESPSTVLKIVGKLNKNTEFDLISQKAQNIEIVETLELSTLENLAITNYLLTKRDNDIENINKSFLNITKSKIAKGGRR